MHRTHDRRLTELERRAEPPGRQYVAYLNHWNPDAEGIVGEAAITATQAAMGPNDELIVVEYVDDWRGAEDDDSLE
jgi:hypothetical protein